MDDETEEPSAVKYPPSPARMSKTPSWAMLGFVIGILVGVALPRKETVAPAPAPAPKAATPAPTPPRHPPLLTTVESVFDLWGGFAVWDNDTTQIAMWNSEDHAFTDFYEVRRVNGALYFRSLPRLTRLVIQRDKIPTECPLQFTITEEQFREWRGTQVQVPMVVRPATQSPQPKPQVEAPRIEPLPHQMPTPVPPTPPK